MVARACAGTRPDRGPDIIWALGRTPLNPHLPVFDPSRDTPATLAQCRTSGHYVWGLVTELEGYRANPGVKRAFALLMEGIDDALRRARCEAACPRSTGRILTARP